jgi:hypothetical protein
MCTVLMYVRCNGRFLVTLKGEYSELDFLSVIAALGGRLQSLYLFSHPVHLFLLHAGVVGRRVIVVSCVGSCYVLNRVCGCIMPKPLIAVWRCSDTWSYLGVASSQRRNIGALQN